MKLTYCYEGASVHVGPGGYVECLLIREPENRGKGYGRELMRLVTQDADAERKTLTIEVDGYCEPIMTNEQLKAWYMRLGFEEQPGRRKLIRYPRDEEGIPIRPAPPAPPTEAQLATERAYRDLYI